MHVYVQLKHTCTCMCTHVHVCALHVILEQVNHSNSINGKIKLKMQQGQGPTMTGKASVV